MIVALLLIQAVPAQASPPDLQLRVHATARSVRVEQKGSTSLRVTAEPDAGSVVDVSAPAVSESARNVTVDIDAQARIADSAAAGASPRR